MSKKLLMHIDTSEQKFKMWPPFFRPRIWSKSNIIWSKTSNFKDSFNTRSNKWKFGQAFQIWPKIIKFDPKFQKWSLKNFNFGHDFKLFLKISNVQFLS